MVGRQQQQRVVVLTEDESDSRDDDDDDAQEQRRRRLDGITEEESTTSGKEADLADEERRRRKRIIKDHYQQQVSAPVYSVRVALFLVLLGTAAVASAGVYWFLSSLQQEAFVTAFDADAHRVIEAFLSNIEGKLTTLDVLSVAYTTYSRKSGQAFPFVSLPSFAARACAVRLLADGLYVFYLPLVTKDQRLPYEKWAETAHSHYMENYALDRRLLEQQDAKLGIHQKTDYSYEPTFDNPHVYRPRIWTGGNGFTNYTVEPAAGTGPWMPMWQMSPTYPEVAVVNANMMGPGLDKALSQVLETGQAVLNLASDQMGRSAITSYFQTAGSRRADSGFVYIPGDPTSNLMYPVFDTFDRSSRQVAGVLVTSMHFSRIFSDVLPPSSKGIVVVLENNKGQVFTYQIDGPSGRYVGSGDLHDRHYNLLKKSADANVYAQARASPATRSYTATDLGDFVKYSLRVYPSATLEQGYVTNDPIFFAILVACLFAVAALLFCLYNFLVEKRQRKLFSRALQSGAIVSQLYPKHFNWIKTPSGRNSTPPTCAELYPHTTVLFADIERFADWSSKRTPAQVFELLETLYNEFDEEATRRRVFKVETIADCYVAVTGCPKAQPDHAVRMVKFARDCMIFKSMGILHSMRETLGEDTADLCFRVGLNSGPVTAGVLKGKKPRFQLFGDTVNTASRMQSNGMEGYIHISETTADELKKLGKGGWIVPRSERIEVKGKGLIQSYWINFTSTSPNNKSVSFAMGDDTEASDCSLNNNEITGGKWNANGNKKNDDSNHSSKWNTNSSSLQLEEESLSLRFLTRMRREGSSSELTSDSDRTPPAPTTLPKPPPPPKSVLSKFSGSGMSSEELSTDLGGFDASSAALTPPELRDIAVPPGKIGIVVEPGEGGIQICTVEESSLLHGLVFAGDVITRFGGLDTTSTAMDADAVCQLMSETLARNKTLTVFSPSKRRQETDQPSPKLQNRCSWKKSYRPEFS